ncbi:MAG: ATPase domain-containing protein [Candidatus Thorarchaeota archaeon]|nr:ATPase domain-containing protein [Candidatus Thorarchaeota archaeon]
MSKSRVSSGVKGFDTLLNGGYIQGRSMLLAGGPGTGKSILTWHFIFDGIEKGESAVLLSLDESAEILIDDMKGFGWDPEKAIDEQKLTILSGTLRLVPTETGYDYVIGFDHPLFREKPFTVPRLADIVKKRAKETKATRIVVDGLGPLLELAGNRFEVRQMVYGFMKELSDQKSTALLTHELRSLSGAQNDEMPYFIADGVVKLDMVYATGDYVRTMRIVKIRGTSHVMRPAMFRIESNGVVVYPDARLPE